jgi:hypothetical protein
MAAAGAQERQPLTVTGNSYTKIKDPFITFAIYYQLRLIPHQALYVTSSWVVCRIHHVDILDGHATLSISYLLVVPQLRSQGIPGDV